MAAFSFNTQNVAPRDSFDVLPAGWYNAQVVESSIDPNKNRNGQILKLTFEILSEGFRNRKIWVRLNIQNQNQDAERISQQHLREICEAAGLNNGIQRDTAELHNRPLQLKLKIRKDSSGQYEDQNEFAGAKPLQAGGVAAAFPVQQQSPLAAPAAAAVPQPAAQDAPAPTANNAAPWLRK